MKECWSRSVSDILQCMKNCKTSESAKISNGISRNIHLRNIEKLPSPRVFSMSKLIRFPKIVDFEHSIPKILRIFSSFKTERLGGRSVHMHHPILLINASTDAIDKCTTGTCRSAQGIHCAERHECRSAQPYPARNGIVPSRLRNTCGISQGSICAKLSMPVSKRATRTILVQTANLKKGGQEGWKKYQEFVI